MPQSRDSLLGLLALLLLPGLAWGLSSDREQPLELEADRKVTRYKQGVSEYTGSVRLDQGSLHLEAERMTLHADSDGELERITAEGDPVRFRQLTDEQVEVRGESRRMEYDLAGQLLTLEDGGVLRYGEDVLESDLIEYEMDTEVLRAGEPGGDDRVHITLQPRDGDDDGEQP